MRGKRVQFDDETWHALDLLGRDRMMDFQELADEAFRDLLKETWATDGPQNSLARKREKGGFKTTYFQEGTFASLNTGAALRSVVWRKR